MKTWKALKKYLTALGEIGVAGIIVADPLIIETCKRCAPNVEVHLSTQQSTMNYMAVKFWEQQGLHRVVLARETTKEEIKEIMEKTDVEIEAFVHGAIVYRLLRTLYVIKSYDGA